MKVEIYRVERRGDGPYRDEYQWCTRDHVVNPNPMKEGLITRGEIDYFKCGFINKKQFKKWFTKKERENLHKRGYKLAVFKIDIKHILVGERQLIFNKRVKVFNKKLKDLRRIR